MSKTTIDRTIAEQEAAEAVARGVEWLDLHGPTNWKRRLQDALYYLDLGDCQRCVFAVLFGSYMTGRWKFDLDGNEASHLGFDSAYGCSFSYDELTEAWREVLS